MPEQLADWTGGNWAATPPPKIKGYSQDTRRLREGDMFVAIKTAQRDGHDFIPAAEQAGASAALVESRVDGDLPQLIVPDTLEGFQSIAAAHRRSFRGKVIGVTGSCGKTSTKDLLALLLGERTLCTEGNLNNFLGVPLTLTRLDNELHDFAVVEAGINEPGEMQVLNQMIAPDIAIVTCVAPAHLEKLGTVEGVATEKAKIANGAAEFIFPGDCLQYAAFQNFSERTWVAADASAANALPDCQNVAYSVSNSGVGSCRLAIKSAAIPPLELELPFTSPGMVSNAVLAIIAAVRCGICHDVIQERLRRWQPTARRGEWRRVGCQSFYLDSYNANPASMAEAFHAFAQSAEESLPRLYVLGGMKELGVASHRFHMEVGEAIPLRTQDNVVLIGREASGYRDGLLRAGRPASQLKLYQDTAQALKAVRAFEGAVLLKGSRAYALETLLPEQAEEVRAC